MKNAYCSDVGKDCSSESEGYGSDYTCVRDENPGETIRTKDVSSCCLDDCKRGCEADLICGENEVCKGNQWAQDSVDENCCMSQCVPASKGGSWWWIILIIVILVAGVLIYFFVIKKKGKKEELDEFGFPKKGEEKSEDEFSDFDLGAVASKPSPKEKDFDKNFLAPRAEPKSVPRPTVETLKSKPAGQYRVPADLFSTRVIPREMPKAKPKAKIIEKTVTKTVTKTVKPKKGKDESEFEDILGKLKKISKK
jgi:hypothetical protein